MLREELFIILGWSSNADGGCMSEFQNPLYHSAFQRSDELLELLLNEAHLPSDHIARASIQVIIDLPSSVLTYDVSGCCQKSESIIDRLIQTLDHSAYTAFKVRLNFTCRTNVEQFIST